MSFNFILNSLNQKGNRYLTFTACGLAGLQIRRSNKDNSEIIFLISQRKHGLGKTVLMRGHNICFNGEILKIIPKLSLLFLLIWSPV